MGDRKTVRWGILSTGGIATTFTKDLTVDPRTRGVNHVVHEVAAAASGSGVPRAKKFLQDVGASSSAKPYGSYEELANDPDLDIIYVATPHSHHYQNVRLCLEAGKNVLCEKAFTSNAAQLKILVDIAKKKNLFLMEAVWTRYFPLSTYVREQITSKRIGTIRRVYADNSMSFTPEKDFADGKHRLVNPHLAGGALLDAGIYSLTWVFQTLYHTQPEQSRKRPMVASALTKYAPTGVDEMTTILLNFPRTNEDGGDAHAVATTALRFGSDPDKKQSAGPSIKIYGDKGELDVFPPAYRPTKTRLVLEDGTIEEKHWPQPGPGKGSGWYNGFGGDQNAEGEGHGMFWEADEAATAVTEGRKEGKFESLAESVLIMEVMDEVRKQGRMRLPDAIETTEYPVKVD